MFFVIIGFESSLRVSNSPTSPLEQDVQIPVEVRGVGGDLGSPTMIDHRLLVHG